jgi:hypothetical protein
MMFNATFNNISVILWQSVFLVEETEGAITTNVGGSTPAQGKKYNIM